MNGEWYFVRAVANGDAFEVQFLDLDGRARATVRFQKGDQRVVLGERLVPHAVLEAAERTLEIGSQYVDDNGTLLDFYGKPLADSNA